MNDRLQIAAMAMQALLTGQRYDSINREGIVETAIDMADALIAAAGEGEEISNNSESIKSDWSLREWFEYNRQYYEYEIIRLDVDKQDELCDLVEKYYKPAPVPSEDEILKVIQHSVLSDESEYVIANKLHQWLTERAK